MIDLKSLELKTLAASTLHMVWEQAYRNMLKVKGPCIIKSDLEDAQRYADSVVASIKLCYRV